MCTEPQQSTRVQCANRIMSLLTNADNKSMTVQRAYLVNVDVELCFIGIFEFFESVQNIDLSLRFFGASLQCSHGILLVQLLLRDFFLSSVVCHAPVFKVASGTCFTDVVCILWIGLERNGRRTLWAPDIETKNSQAEVVLRGDECNQVGMRATNKVGMRECVSRRVNYQRT